MKLKEKKEVIISDTDSSTNTSPVKSKHSEIFEKKKNKKPSASSLMRIADTDVGSEDDELEMIFKDIVSANVNSEYEVTNEMSKLYLSKSQGSEIIEDDNIESDLEIDDDLLALKETGLLESTYIEEEENDIDEEEWVDANDKDELIMTETNRGEKKAGYRGYYYTVDKKENSAGKTNWKCEITTIKRKGEIVQIGCKARLWNFNNGDDPVERHEHNHEPNPEIFKQLYTLNVQYKGVNLPFFYAPLLNKKETTYKAMFDMLAGHI